MQVLLYAFILAFIASAQSYPSINPLSAVADDGEILLRLKRGHHGGYGGDYRGLGGGYEGGFGGGGGWGGNYGGYPGYPGNRRYVAAPSNQYAIPIQSASSSASATGGAGGAGTSASANAVSSTLGGFPAGNFPYNFIG